MRCVYVGKGPSWKYARKELKTDSVAALNEAVAWIDMPVDFGIYYDLECLLAVRSYWNKIVTFIMPPQLHIRGGIEKILPWEVKGLDEGKVRIFDPIICSDEPETLKLALENSLVTKRAVVHTTALFGLSALAVLGYKHITCYGFDLNVDTPIIYRSIQLGMRTSVPLLKEIFGTTVTFYGED